MLQVAPQTLTLSSYTIAENCAPGALQRAIWWKPGRSLLSTIALILLLLLLLLYYVEYFLIRPLMSVNIANLPTLCSSKVYRPNQVILLSYYFFLLSCATVILWTKIVIFIVVVLHWYGHVIIWHSLPLIFILWRGLWSFPEPTVHRR